MSPESFDELDWDEGNDFAERVTEMHFKELEGFFKILGKMFEVHAKALARTRV